MCTMSIAMIFSVRTKSYFLLTLSAIAWGATMMVVKPALEHTTPFRLLFYRYILATILTLPVVYYYSHQSQIWSSVWKKVLPIELIGVTLSLGLLYLGLKHTSAIEASLISTTLPIFVTIAGIIALKEKLERHELIGTCIAFLATLLLTIRPLHLSSSELDMDSSGNFIILISIIIAAVHVILVKKFYNPYPKLLLAALSFWVGLASFFILSLVELRLSFMLLWQTVLIDLSTPMVLGSAFFMAFFTSIIGLTAFLKGQEGVEASEASLFWYLEPLVYLPLSFLLYQDAPDLVEILALVGILFGVAWAEKRFHKLRKLHHDLRKHLSSKRKKRRK